MKQIAQKLEAEIAKAVSLIITASHAAALEALDDAFGLGQQRRQRGPATAPRRLETQRASAAPRRSATEIQALEQKLLQAVWENPGEPMSILAPRVGATPSQLQVPVARLKANRKIKTVGERQFTRYFPIEQASSRVEAASG